MIRKHPALAGAYESGATKWGYKMVWPGVQNNVPHISPWRRHCSTEYKWESCLHFRTIR